MCVIDDCSAIIEPECHRTVAMMNNRQIVVGGTRQQLAHAIEFHCRIDPREHMRVILGQPGIELWISVAGLGIDRCVRNIQCMEPLDCEQLFIHYIFQWTIRPAASAAAHP